MQSILTYIQSEISHLYTESESKTIGYLLLEKITGLSRVQILLNKNTTFSEDQKHLLQTFIEKLKNNEPIQYVLGSADFYGLSLIVTPAVLIPRPETEELVDWIRSEYPSNKALRILDIGTGSGCIALALKRIFPNAQVSAFDISEQALAIANENAKQLQLEVSFKQTDILNIVENVDYWDIIVSNPPYIPKKNEAEMDATVINHEPHIALFVPDEDPLLFYRKITESAGKSLVSGGQLFFEIHHDAGEATRSLIQGSEFSSVELRKDISGNDRMIKAIKKAL